MMMMMMMIIIIIIIVRSAVPENPTLEQAVTTFA